MSRWFNRCQRVKHQPFRSASDRLNGSTRSSRIRGLTEGWYRARYRRWNQEGHRCGVASRERATRQKLQRQHTRSVSPEHTVVDFRSNVVPLYGRTSGGSCEATELTASASDSDHRSNAPNDHLLAAKMEMLAATQQAPVGPPPQETHAGVRLQTPHFYAQHAVRPCSLSLCGWTCWR